MSFDLFTGFLIFCAGLCFGVSGVTLFLYYENRDPESFPTEEGEDPFASDREQN